MSIEQRLASRLLPLIEQGANCFNVAYSGGVDSQLLLELCNKLRLSHPHISLQAIHVNHGLSTNADKWQYHCQHQCETMDIPLVTATVKVDRNSPLGLEAAARNARYDALFEHCAPGSVLVLGQHRNDQLETMLLQLKRGAGPKGLSAMPAQSEGPNGIKVLRPLLEIGRKDIENWAEKHGLNWQEDESNQDRAFDRNFLRHEIIPHLEQRWPEFATSVSRSARLCAKQQALLEEVCAQHIADMHLAEDQLDITKLTCHSLAWREEIIRYWLKLNTVDMPSEKVLIEFEGVLSAKEDANPVVCWGTWQVRRFQKRLYVLSQLADVEEQIVSLAEPVSVDLPDELGKLEVTGNPLPDQESFLKVAYGGFGQKFKPDGEAMSKPLKQWFKLWNIPPWERQRIPLVYLDNTLLGIVLKDGLMFSAGNCAERRTGFRLMRP